MGDQTHPTFHPTLVLACWMKCWMRLTRAIDLFLYRQNAAPLMQKLQSIILSKFLQFQIVLAFSEHYLTVVTVTIFTVFKIC